MLQGEWAKAALVGLDQACNFGGEKMVQWTDLRGF